ncbi:hypothetical protein MPSEU_000969200 [Mayamaea pseudoterrestris]|nr:hypothetical protein MPSEU_000969200 [Mayamaea pseudoterrestris]
MIFDNIQADITPGTILSWENITSMHVASFWNSLSTRSVYIESVITTPIEVHRLDATKDQDGIDQSAFRIVPTWEFRNDTYAPPNANQFLLKAVSISYNQTIVYALRTPGGDGSTPTVATDDDDNDNDDDDDTNDADDGDDSKSLAGWNSALLDTSQLVQQLFMVPFEWGSAPFVQSLTDAVNNTIPVRLRSIQVSNAVPTMAPIMMVDENAKVNDDDRTIIITVVITLLSLLFAGGYIIFLTQKEGQLQQQERMNDRSSMAFGMSGRFMYEEEDDDDGSTSSGDSMLENGERAARYYYHNQDNFGKDKSQEQPQKALNGSGIKTTMTMSSNATHTNTTSMTSQLDDPHHARGDSNTSAGKLSVIPLPPHAMQDNMSGIGSDRDNHSSTSVLHHQTTLSLDSGDASAADGDRSVYHALPMSVIGNGSSYSRDGNMMNEPTNDATASRRTSVEGSERLRRNSFHSDGQGQQQPSPLAFSGFQMEVHDLDD